MFKGLVTLVTGGASGLGKATVERLVQLGGRVILCDLPTSKGQEVAKNLDVSFAPVDVTEQDDVKAALDMAKQKYGKLDAAVNCAGIVAACKTYDFEKKMPHSLEDFQRIINVNLVGTFNVIRLAVGLIGENQPNKDGQRGVIVNTSSVTAFDGGFDLTAYSASKAALVGFTLPLARDLAPQGIRVCTIAPGMFKTPMTEKVPEEVAAVIATKMQFPKRNGEPSEYAQLVTSIMENSMLNGEVIRLDGAIRLFP